MKRGEIWKVHLDPTVGHEQAGTRPALVLSVEEFNASRADLIVVLPVTSKARALPSRVRVAPPEGGLSRESWVICEQPRTISKSRFRKRMGVISGATLRAVEVVVSLLLGLPPPTAR
jgi:mRNA interferase MazF